MWKAPTRPRDNGVTQCFDDGLVAVYAVTDGARPGLQPQPVLRKKATLRYAEMRLGINRLYSGRQNQVDVQRVLRVPRPRLCITNQDAAVTQDGVQYRIDAVQAAPDVYPPCLDLTLTRVVQALQEEGAP